MVITGVSHDMDKVLAAWMEGTKYIVRRCTGTRVLVQVTAAVLGSLSV